MQTLNKLFLALAFLGSSAAAQATDGMADGSRIDLSRNSKKLTGIMLASTARLSVATPTMSRAYSEQASSLSQGPDNYLPAQHRL